MGWDSGAAAAAAESHARVAGRRQPHGRHQADRADKREATQATAKIDLAMWGQ